MPSFQHLFLNISGVLYVGLATNVLLAVSSAPLLAVLLFTDPTQAVLLVALAAVLAAPGLPAAFEVFASFSDTGEAKPLRSFVSGWWRHLRRSLAVGAAAVGVLTLLTVDLAWAWGKPIGAAAIPLLVTAMVVTAAVALAVLVGSVERPAEPLRRLAKAGVYLMVRNLHLTALSATGVAVLVTIIVHQPALGLGIATAPLLYIVWANTRRSLHPLLRKAGHA